MNIPDTVRQMEGYQGSCVCPADFALFWEQKNREAAQPRPVVWRRAAFENPMARYWELEFPGTDGALLRARYIRPVGDAPVPLLLYFHDEGRGVRGWHHMTRFIALGFAVLALENRGWSHDPAGGWQNAPQGLELAQLYTDALTAAHVAENLPGVDCTRMLAWGEGLGGGLAIVAAALLPGQVRRCAALHPMPADFRKVWESGGDSGFGGALRIRFREGDPGHAREAALFAALGYLDLCQFAPLVRGEVLIGTGLMDTIVPPAAQYAVYNRVACKKRHLVYPNYMHERINFFENELPGFFRLEQTESGEQPC